MDVQVLNFKPYTSGLMVGWFDLSVCGIVVTGCKAFQKPGEKGEPSLWFAWPSQQVQDKDGENVWKDIVIAAEPVMRHLQGLFRAQIRGILSSTPSARYATEGAARRPQATSKGFKGASPRREAEVLSRHRTPPGTDDGIPY